MYIMPLSSVGIICSDELTMDRNKGIIPISCLCCRPNQPVSIYAKVAVDRLHYQLSEQPLTRVGKKSLRN